MNDQWGNTNEGLNGRIDIAHRTIDADIFDYDARARKPNKLLPQWQNAVQQRLSPLGRYRVGLRSKRMREPRRGSGNFLALKRLNIGQATSIIELKLSLRETKIEPQKKG